jgi:hypothetical protein
MLISPTGHIQLKGPSAFAGKANASSGQNFVTNEPYYFGPILPDHDPRRKTGVRVGETWDDRLEEFITRNTMV